MYSQLALRVAAAQQTTRVVLLGDGRPAVPARLACHSAARALQQTHGGVRCSATSRACAGGYNHHAGRCQQQTVPAAWLCQLHWEWTVMGLALCIAMGCMAAFGDPCVWGGVGHTEALAGFGALSSNAHALRCGRASQSHGLQCFCRVLAHVADHSAPCGACARGWPHGVMLDRARVGSGSARSCLCGRVVGGCLLQRNCQ